MLSQEVKLVIKGIYSNDCKVVIEDTQKKMGDIHVHFGKVD